MFIQTTETEDSGVDQSALSVQFTDLENCSTVHNIPKISRTHKFMVRGLTGCKQGKMQIDNIGRSESQFRSSPVRSEISSSCQSKEQLSVGIVISGEKESFRHPEVTRRNSGAATRESESCLSRQFTFINKSHLDAIFQKFSSLNLRSGSEERLQPNQPRDSDSKGCSSHSMEAEWVSHIRPKHEENSKTSFLPRRSRESSRRVEKFHFSLKQ